MKTPSTMLSSELIKIIQHCIDHYGDRPVYFSDGFYRYGIDCHPESAPNFDSPKAILIKAFGLIDGKTFEAPILLSAEGKSHD